MIEPANLARLAAAQAVAVRPSDAKIRRDPTVTADITGRADALTPPIDMVRVADIRAALKAGTYVIDSRTIAESMIRADLAIG